MENDYLAYFQEAVKTLIDSVTSLIKAAEAIRECEAFIKSSENKTFESNEIQQICDVRSNHECICIFMFMHVCVCPL